MAIFKHHPVSRGIEMDRYVISKSNLEVLSLTQKQTVITRLWLWPIIYFGKTQDCASYEAFCRPLTVVTFAAFRREEPGTRNLLLSRRFMALSSGLLTCGTHP